MAMISYKIILGFITVVLAFLGYIPYIIDVIKGKTKPHAFSWFVWVVLEITAFSIQFINGAGAGSWVTGFTGFFCILIFLLSIFKGTKEFPLADWLAFFGALSALTLWLLLKNPAASVILITITDALAFLPTFRKTYFHPHQETALMYLTAGTKFFISLFALDSFTFVTALYPSSLVLTNFALLFLLYFRRKRLATK